MRRVTSSKGSDSSPPTFGLPAAARQRKFQAYERYVRVKVYDSTISPSIIVVTVKRSGVSNRMSVVPSSSANVNVRVATARPPGQLLLRKLPPGLINRRATVGPIKTKGPRYGALRCVNARCRY